MIIGGGFRNKGAMSMLLTMVSELRKRYDNCEIYFATGEKIDTKLYKFHKIKYTHGTKQIAIGGMNTIKGYCYSVIADAVNFVLNKHTFKGHYFDLKKLMPQLDLVLDISGFGLGDKWGKVAHEEYYDSIILAKKYNVKMILMPQSFGPFYYNSDMQYLNEKNRELLKYPYVIYAREPQGESMLKELYNLDNVRRTPDLVIQNKEINLKMVFNGEPDINIPENIGDNSVAIIPNMKCFKNRETSKMLELYKNIILKLLDNSMEVCVFRHSYEDLDICKSIKEIFRDDERVRLFENDFSCIEYCEIIKKFRFSVVSRFHGVVHSYKNDIPCIVLGWAVKYNELAKDMDQAEFAFDITDNSFNEKEVIGKVEKMFQTCDEQKEKIKKRLEEIQCFNCFKVLEEVFDE